MISTSTIPVTEEYLERPDGPRIFVRSWRPASVPRAVVAICHGLNSHSGQYFWAAEQLSAGSAWHCWRKPCGPYRSSGDHVAGRVRHPRQRGCARRRRANFGIAEMLTVETESTWTGERTFCRAEKAKLSLKDDCIELRSLESKQQPGTTITANAEAESRINVHSAKNYIAEFVSLVDIPIYVNRELVSQKPVETAVPVVPVSWRDERKAHKLGERLTADISIVLSNNAEIVQ